MANSILRLPHSFSNTAAKIALGWPSMHSISTIRKLKFLSRVTTTKDSVSNRASSPLWSDMEWTTLQNSDIKARGQAVHLSRPIQMKI